MPAPEFFPEVSLSALQAEALARGLYTVAAADGVHERELALISDFYQEAVAYDASAASVAIARLERSGAIEPTALAESLPDGAQRLLFVKTALLLAWADGSVSDKERAQITAFANALAVDGAAVLKLEADVKDFLLRPLAGLANVEAVAKIAKKLGA